jgi:hypothetical protein
MLPLASQQGVVKLNDEEVRRVFANSRQRSLLNNGVCPKQKPPNHRLYWTAGDSPRPRALPALVGDRKSRC